MKIPNIRGYIFKNHAPTPVMFDMPATNEAAIQMMDAEVAAGTINGYMLLLRKE